jgi:hypothetical protein
MAFCNSCGATLTTGTQFCNKCGAAVAAVPPAASARPSAAPAPAPKGGSSALKVILIVIAVIVGIGILGMVTCGIVIHRIAKSSHMTQQGDKVKVEMPFGTINNDPEQAVKDLGIEVYAGAQAQKAGSADVTILGVHTVTANFESSDSADKICDFYKSKFPAANVKTFDQNHCTIVSEDPKNVVTINVQASGDTTRFQIASVTKKGASSN